MKRPKQTRTRRQLGRLRMKLARRSDRDFHELRDPDGQRWTSKSVFASLAGVPLNSALAEVVRCCRCSSYPAFAGGQESIISGTQNGNWRSWEFAWRSNPLLHLQMLLGAG